MNSKPRSSASATPRRRRRRKPTTTTSSAASEPWSSGRRCRAASIRRPMSPVSYSLLPTTARACRCRCSTGAARSSTARRQCSSPAMALTVTQSRRVFRPTASRSSTAASCSRSPMYAAARTRAGAGTRMASSARKRTPSAISSPRRGSSSPRVSPAPGGSWLKAAAPGACSWGRSPISRLTFSPGSSPTCRSSTCWRRCSIRACR